MFKHFIWPLDEILIIATPLQISQLMNDDNGMITHSFRVAAPAADIV